MDNFLSLFFIPSTLLKTRKDMMIIECIEWEIGICKMNSSLPLPFGFMVIIAFLIYKGHTNKTIDNKIKWVFLTTILINITRKESFTFLLNKVFVAASKPKAKRNKTGFILYASNSPPLNSRAKNKSSFNFFSTIGLIASI